MSRHLATRLNDTEVRRYLIERWYTFRPTTDDWVPTWPDGTVAISPILPLNNGKFRVCLRGMDDFSLERDFEREEDARQLILALPAIITIADLQARGFLLG